ncbi:hypothetical protein LTR10_016564 [Elasticomyces elasticus]|uniref:Amino acid permease/ SLC12A domain-containing protein n=1 Tax=Exophiala sideris TaxID=1016849 RepID=A0ABR0IX10_9EURO|nr:hypothetical protein LTR10_016564 [Elasticomyces elasticus]KAK5022070.1 hypothetical protein LTS07_010486 [Exophiala sideris]KAK5026262.1 hypothetical protein LTR13_010043 [Exophiala sideris]KAK5051051.1 hypothetical protein LTR69_010427 [Exophiala sideris]KAK5177305.1 hypothetical protein LTR44_010267 [Eurotiomycetes sp. CCFEE 6388]
MSTPAETNGWHNPGVENGIDLSGSNATPSGTGLPYRVTGHRRGWAIWFAFFCFDGCVLPIILFYGLWYGSKLSHWTILAILTSLSFWTSYHKWFSRGYRLFIKRDPKFRPINGNRWAFDCSYYILSLALLIMILELVIATSTKNVPVRVISMAPPSVAYTIGIYMLIQNTAHCLKVRTPVTLSSIKRGSVTPPPLFTVMEDVFAADGCHMGLPAREAMVALYNGNPKFRRSLMLWSWIWCFWMLAVAIAMSIAVGETSQTTGFGIAYGVTFPSIVVMAVVTAWWMDRQDAKGAFSVSAGQGKILSGSSMRDPARSRP